MDETGQRVTVLEAIALALGVAAVASSWLHLWEVAVTGVVGGLALVSASVIRRLGAAESAGSGARPDAAPVAGAEEAQDAGDAARLEESLATLEQRARKTLNMVRPGVRELEKGLRKAMDSHATQHSDKLTTAERRISNRVSKDLAAAVEAVQATTERIGASERRVQATLETERLHTQERFAEFADGLRVHADAVEHQVGQLAGRINAMEESLRCVTDRPGLVESIVTGVEHGRGQSRDILVRRMTEVMQQHTGEIEALLQLMPQVERRAMMPASGRWAMDARALLHLVEVVNTTRPSRVVELGGGTSTVWLGYLCEQLGATLVSVDHDSSYLRRTRENIARHGLETVVDCRLAPLSEQIIEGRTYHWYDPDVFADVDEIDLLVVDGPPKATGDRARWPAWPALRDRFTDTCVVVLDDADRPEEVETLGDWLEHAPEYSRFDEDVSRLAVLRKDG